MLDRLLYIAANFFRFGVAWISVVGRRRQPLRKRCAKPNCDSAN